MRTARYVLLAPEAVGSSSSEPKLTLDTTTVASLLASACLPASRAELLHTEKKRGNREQPDSAQGFSQRVVRSKVTCRHNIPFLVFPQPTLLSRLRLRSHTRTRTRTHTKADARSGLLACRLLLVHVALHIPLEQGDADKDGDQAAAHSHHSRDPSLLGVWGLLPTILQATPVSSNTGGQHAHRHYAGRRACVRKVTHGLGGSWQAPRPNPHSQAWLCLHQSVS